MEFKELEIKEIQHGHPLILEDFQLVFHDYEEDDDEFDDRELIAKQTFKCTCDMCGLEIDWYHRYYYKCCESSCNYSLHKFCAEMPTTLRFPAHSIHTLLLKKGPDSWSCHACLTQHQDGICYHCSTCNYAIDLPCVTFVDQTTIHHPGHPHPLISATLDTTLSKCFACGKKHEGVFYHCITCFNFSIHVDCVTLPFKFSLENLHRHMLTLSHNFSVIPDNSKCRICRMSISDRLWLYKCTKCRYYVHLDCAASRGESFMSILSRGIGKTAANFIAADYPDLLLYPLPDESYNILPHQFRSGKDYRHLDQIRFDNGFYVHSSHVHPLLLINTTDTSILGSGPVSLHDPMKRIKLLCNGCLRPITTTPFYMCKQVHESCDFYLHEWCTKLPTKLENHPGHPEHTLDLFHNLPTEVYDGFECNICRLRCNGFGYVCSECDYRVDVNCGFIPETITHEAHPNHLLSVVDPSSIQSTSTQVECEACNIIIKRSEICFKCISCDFYLDNRCALHLPKTIKNKYDKHPLTLSYSPIESHKSQYFCEVCEEELNPEKWFYHCLECGQSIHSACAPLILKSEQGVNSLRMEGVYMFLNIKFGRLVRLREYIYGHCLSFHAGTTSDDCCEICERKLQSSLIFRCTECTNAYHVNCIQEVATWSEYSDSKYEAFIKTLPELEKELKNETTTALTFFPSRATRPITGHWKAAQGGVIKQS